MKTERRHELRNNDLAHLLGRQIDLLKPYARAIVGLLLVGSVAVVASLYYSNRSIASRGEGWQEYYEAVEAGNEQFLRELALRRAGSEVGLWALRTVAEGQLAEGSRMLFDDRERANELLSEAQGNYEQVVQGASLPLLKRQALFGLAQSYEARNDLENATRRYDELHQQYPATVLGERAQEALVRLRQQEQFYGWFFDQRPQPSSALTGDNKINFGDVPTDPPQGDTNFLGEESDPPFGTNLIDGLESDSGEDPDLDFSDLEGNSEVEQTPEEEATNNPTQGEETDGDSTSSETSQ